MAGCTSHYWRKPGSDVDAFGRDSVTCTHRVAVPVVDRRGYDVLDTNAYRRCLLSLGWERIELDGKTPPPGIFRGIEDDGIVRLDAVPPQREVDSDSYMQKCVRGVTTGPCR